MTADISTQRKHTASSNRLHNLTLAFAAFTLLFALISIIFGNRLATLQTNYLKTKNETAISEAASIQDMETALNAATTDIQTIQKALDAEKAAAAQLRRQLSIAMKELKMVKADLDIANQTITERKSTLPAEPAPSVETPDLVETLPAAPSVETVLSPEPSPPPAPNPTNPSTPLPVPTQTPSETPTVNRPEALESQAPELPAEKPAKQVSTPTPAAAASMSSENVPPVPEETISEAPGAPSTAVPPAD